MKRLGLIVNPIAGIGGRLGLKGTDGYTLQALNAKYGATPVSAKRAQEALEVIKASGVDVEIVTCGGGMGFEIAKSLFDVVTCVGQPEVGETTSADTVMAAKRIAEASVDILMFVGGDGTARDIYAAVGADQVCIGVPSGVKMHSGVYGLSPMKSGELVSVFLSHGHMRTETAEVMDIDEEAYRDGKVYAKLFGYLSIPVDRRKTQNKKSGSHESERYFQDAIACYMLDHIMDEDTYYVLGPGTTTAQIQRKLEQPFTLLGVDIVYRGKTIARDLNESQLVQWIEGKRTKLVITPTGGQGFLLGRGNQQISGVVVRSIGMDNIIVIATKNKLLSLGASPLYVDLDDACNEGLGGYRKVITGYDDVVLKKVTY
ncbi:MAG: ATP-NAD kinase family protein [Clostridia bacterium]|nr:ATP-NAD kinase family protein [Clostridia bacterium]